MNDIKPILAIETSADLCSVCAYISDEVYQEVNVNLRYSHAEKLFDLVSTVVSLSGYPLEQFQSIAVSEGPGSFTGLRIGFSAAKGLAAGANLPIISVPTYDAFALFLIRYLPENSDFIIANKVNTTEIYFSRFHIKGNSYIFAENLQILTSAEFLQKSKELLVFGNASADIQRNGLTSPPACAVAKWALIQGKSTFDYDFIEPNYMKNFIIKEKKK